MRIVFLFCLCLVATSVHAGDDGRWIVDKTTGCKVWSSLADATREFKLSWSGECEGGIATGKGILKKVYLDSADGKKFERRINSECILKKGKVEGQVTITWELVGLPFGVLVDSRSGKFIGEVKDGEGNGNGTSIVYDVNGGIKIKYVGEFKNDKYEKGTLSEANGDQYTGEFKDNMKDGKGTLTEANGDKYVGEFKDNKKHGKGKFIFKGGSSYEGLWENGERIKIF